MFSVDDMMFQKKNQSGYFDLLPPGRNFFLEFTDLSVFPLNLKTLWLRSNKHLLKVLFINPYPLQGSMEILQSIIEIPISALIDNT